MNSSLLRRLTRGATALSVIVATAAGVAYAACWDATRPDSQYVVQSATGTVVDTVTNLMWKQCQEGVSGATCTTGGSSFLSWDAAQSAASNSRVGGYNDWRLPTLLELQSTVASSCASSPPLPWINGTAFPNTPTATVFWSATPNAGSSTNATALWFKDGSTQTFDRGTGFYVRLVRGGQAFGLLAPTPQTVSFLADATTLPYGGSTTLVAFNNGPNSGNPLVFGSNGVYCTVDASSGVLTPTPAAHVGDVCQVTLTQFGRASNGQNFAKAPEVAKTILISKALQTLSFAAPPGISVGGTGVVAATSDQGLTPVTFTSTAPGVCTVSGSTVTGVAVGLCSITALQSGNVTYLPAAAALNFGIASAVIVCNLHMDGANPMLATKEGLILLRAMLGFTGTAVTNGTGIATPWATIRDDLNTKCGTAFQ